MIIPPTHHQLQSEVGEGSCVNFARYILPHVLLWNPPSFHPHCRRYSLLPMSQPYLQRLPPLKLLAISASTVSPIPITTASHEDDNDSLFSIKCSTLDYKSSSDLPMISPTCSTPRNQMSQLQQLNTAVLGISTRLSALEDGIFLRLSRREGRMTSMAYRPA